MKFLLIFVIAIPKEGVGTDENVALQIQLSQFMLNIQINVFYIPSSEQKSEGKNTILKTIATNCINLSRRNVKNIDLSILA